MTAAWLDAFLHVFGLFAALTVFVVAPLAVAIGVQRWWERGLRRRAERLNAWSTDPKTITDREIESLR